MISQQRLNELAHLDEECPKCHGKKAMPHPIPHRRIAGEMVDCITCGGSGKVFVFPAEVRVPCQHKHGTAKTWIIKEQRYVWKCVDCSGLGTVASQDGMVWIGAAEGSGYEVRFESGLCLLLKGGQIWMGEDPNPFEALILAIEKAVEK